MSPRTAALLIGTVAAAGCAFGRGPQQAGAGENVARGRPVAVYEGRGEGARVTDGRLATEGTFPRGFVVALDGVEAASVVDLGRPRHVAALLLQASTSDVYFVETSTDGASWHVAWRVASLPGRPELRTWTTVLPRPAPARWLRVRTTTSHSAAVSELQAFETETPDWPPRDTDPPGSPPPLWPHLGPERLAAVYEALSALLMLVVGWGLLARRSGAGARAEHLRRSLLVTLAFASLAAWPYLFSFHSSRFVHASEAFHYYMGAKYLPELGYSRLYACTVVVDAEDGVSLAGRVVRDLRDNRRVPAVSQLERAAECHARFTAQRWAAFRHDTAFFRGVMGEQRWFKARNDHGFNATPAWTVLGGLLTRLTPVSWAHLLLLSLIDVVLIALVFVMIGRAFDLESTAVAAGYFGVCYLCQFGWTGGSILRYDWLFWLVGGVTALRTGRQALGGFALTAATLMRLFPVCALLALGLKVLAEGLQERSARPLLRRRRLAGGVLAACLLFLPASAALYGGPRIWMEFADNSAKHLSTEAVNFVSLGTYLAYDHGSRLSLMTDPLLPDHASAWKERLAASARRARPAQWAAAAGFVLLLFLAVRVVPDWTAATLGVGLMPMLLKLAGYYYSGWLIYAALLPLSASSGFALAAFAWATNVIPRLWPEADEAHAWLSLAAALLATGITGAFAWRGRHRRPESPEGTPGTGSASGSQALRASEAP